MIRETHGNLLADDADALVNTVNTVGAMGKGIALQFKRAYPEMFRAYEKAAKAGELHVGQVHVWDTGALDGPRYILNFPTKRHWRAPSRLEDIRAGLVDLVRVVQELGITSIALPPLGCGNGGLDWSVVAPLIWDAFTPLAGAVDVRVYAPEGAPPAREMINRTKAPALTPVRAALLSLMTAYQEIAWEWPGVIDTQKLAYFLQMSGEAMRLDFEKGPYGPYADNLRKTLSLMEGHYILGFGDGSARPLDAEPLEVTDAARAALGATVATASATQDRTRRVVDLIQGFESTYGLELLASVHWAATQAGALNPEAAREYIRSWTRRKAGLFAEDHVQTAWKALEAGDWIRTPAAV